MLALRTAAPRHALVVAAVVVCVAARIGSEAAAQSSTVFAIAERLRSILSPRGNSIGWAALCALVVWQLLRCSRNAHTYSTAANAHSSDATARPTDTFRWLVVLAAVFAAHGAVQWHQLATPQRGEFTGVAVAQSDAVVRGVAVTLTVEVAGENFRLAVYGRDRAAVRSISMGDLIFLDAVREPYDARTLRFFAGRHVQGQLRTAVVHATAPSPKPWHRAANRIHEVIDRGSRTMQPDDAALVRGLVLGDESRQPSRMTEAFRTAGLGHLLAVSGQNVALLLAALTPGLRRMSRWPRLVTALGIVAMFGFVTRLESSVVRAGVMAAVVQVGYAIGRDVLPLRALAITVVAIVAIDPLATWSVGFVLSVAATTGLVVIAPRLGQSMFAATTSAQLGVAPFALWWFGALPIVALATNVLAVPVASAVMIVGPPLLGIAMFVPDAAAEWCAIPVAAGARWVWWVADLASRPSVPMWLNVGGWVIAIAVVARRLVHPPARL